MPYPSKTDRQSILNTALQQVSDNGVQSLSLRGVAASLELAPNALYKYFSDKATLESSITAESVRMLHQSMLSVAKKNDPISSIRAISSAYVRFAQDHGNLYEMIMRPCEASLEDASAQVELWKFFVSQVANMVGESRAIDASISLWAFLHGMTALKSARLLSGMDLAGGFEFGIDAWIMQASKSK